MSGPRLKDLGRWYSGGTPPSEQYEYWDGDIPWLSGKDFDETRLREPTKFTTVDGARLFSRWMPAGRSILVLVRGMALAHGLPIARLSFDAAINQDVRGLVVSNAFDPNFVHYALLGHRALLEIHIDRAAHGTARARDTLYGHRICWMPALTGQRRVADFLDRECERIDRCVSSIQPVLEQLGVLSDSATDRFAADSLVRLKAGLVGGPVYGASENSSVGEPDWPRFVRITDIDAHGELRQTDVRRLEPTLARDYMLVDGDVLVARSGATVGKAFGYRESEHGRCSFAGYLVRMRCDRTRLLPEFLLLVTRSRLWWDQVALSLTQATIQNISAARYSGFLIPMPSIEVQQATVDEVGARAKHHACARDVSKRLLSALTDYRNSLIHEAVTGKLDVSRVSEAQMDERLHAATENRLADAEV